MSEEKAGRLPCAAAIGGRRMDRGMEALHASSDADPSSIHVTRMSHIALWTSASSAGVQGLYFCLCTVRGVEWNCKYPSYVPHSHVALKALRPFPHPGTGLAFCGTIVFLRLVHTGVCSLEKLWPVAPPLTAARMWASHQLVWVGCLEYGTSGYVALGTVS